MHRARNSHTQTRRMKERKKTNTRKGDMHFAKEET